MPDLQLSSFRMERQSGEVPLPRFGHTCTLLGDSFVVLFGGATGDSGRYSINNDAYMLDLRTTLWRRLGGGSGSPSPRAAHGACRVDHMQMVVYGGATGGGTLTGDELYLLDARSVVDSSSSSSSSLFSFSWAEVHTEGPSPGKRYGHTMVFSKPLLVVFGGNNGQTTLNDVWVMDLTSLTSLRWSPVQLMDVSRGPCARVYHSGDACVEGPAAGMVVIFGGRTSDNKSLKDAWGLRQHRDGRWDWVEAPTRRGISAEPRYQHWCVFYGRKLLVIGGRGNEGAKTPPLGVYDTDSCEWLYLARFGLDRFRHSVWTWEGKLFSYGGFSHAAPSAPTNDLLCVEAIGLVSGASEVVATANSSSSLVSSGASSPVIGAACPPLSLTLSSQVYVATDDSVRRVGLEMLGEESKKMRNLGLGPSLPTMNVLGQNFFSGLSLDQGVLKQILDRLLRPGENWAETGLMFFVPASSLVKLAQAATDLVKSQPMVLQLRAPVKVYGDLHGQFSDLMRMFAKYGAPCDGVGGDIDTTDYLFLGDFVDRGSHSLETITLLLALKLKHPSQIHLIRGNHEDAVINALYGFKDECRRRLGEDPDLPGSFWAVANEFFEYLPCGAVIEQRVLCIHGGIGGTINSVKEIESLSRPLKVNQAPTNLTEQRVTDLLWSDPSDSDAIHGVIGNETRDPDGSGKIVKFGPDRVHQFLRNNPPLELIVRAHECVMDGFERFAGGKLITVFSATDYCGHHKNAGALLFIRKDLTVVPKLIYPAVMGRVGDWDNQVTQARPPTPPRERSERIIDR